MPHESISTREKKDNFEQIPLLPIKEKNYIEETTIKLEKKVLEYAMLNSSSILSDSDDSVLVSNFNDNLITEKQQKELDEINAGHEFNLVIKHWKKYKPDGYIGRLNFCIGVMKFWMHSIASTQKSKI